MFLTERFINATKAQLKLFTMRAVSEADEIRTHSTLLRVVGILKLVYMP